MQIRATIIKLLTQYVPDQLCKHIALELDNQAAHYQTVGAPRRAAYARAQAEVMRETAKKLDTLPY